MPVTPKVFIYSGQGSSDESIADLTELFTSTEIFATRPDITHFWFDFNPAGLHFPILVIPGGFTVKMANPVNSQIKLLRSHFDDKFHYVGICAGGFLGTSESNYFITSNTLHPLGCFNSPDYWGTTANQKIITDYDAIGSFYPTHPHSLRKDFYHAPYRVRLNLSNGQTISQLYLGGPGFFANQSSANTQSIATFADITQHKFEFKRHDYRTFNNLSAILQTAPSETRGGRLLAGTHIETCVPNSRFLRFFRSSHDEQRYTALPTEDLSVLDAEQESNHQFVKGLLRSTLN